VTTEGDESFAGYSLDGIISAEKELYTDSRIVIPNE
jgi:hypothetical protein